jgi:hypothetical protein
MAKILGLKFSLTIIGLKHLEIFAVLPFRNFGLEAFDLGVLDIDVVINEFGAHRIAEERVILQRGRRFA